MLFGIKSKKEKEAERLRKEQEERQRQEEKRRQPEMQFSEAKEQLANSLFGIGYNSCNHTQLCRFDEAFRKRFPEMVHLLDQERRNQLLNVQNKIANQHFRCNYHSCCWRQANAVNSAILYDKEAYQELHLYVPSPY